MTSGRFAGAVRLLDDAAGSAYPGAVLAVLWRGDVAVLHATARTAARSDAPVATPETRYDLASLTKVVGTLPLVLQAVAEARLTLDEIGRAHV